jgi:DnaK suppressor protein
LSLAVAWNGTTPDPAATWLKPRNDRRRAEYIADMKARQSDLISQTETDAYYEILLAKKGQLLQDFSVESARLVEGGPIADDDQPAFLHEQFISLQKHSLDYQVLKQIDAALERLAAGDFGGCLACGEAISNRRLNAIPWAEYCIRCQEDAMRSEEKAGGRALSLALPPTSPWRKYETPVQFRFSLGLSGGDHGRRVVACVSSVQEQEKGSRANRQP